MITSPEGRRDDPPGFGGSIALATRRMASNSSVLAAGPPRQDTSASSPWSGHRRGRSSDLWFNPRSYRLGARKVRKGAVLPRAHPLAAPVPALDSLVAAARATGPGHVRRVPYTKAAPMPGSGVRP